MDLVCGILVGELQLTPDDTIAVLTAETSSGLKITGQDSVIIVP